MSDFEKFITNVVGGVLFVHGGIKLLEKDRAPLRIIETAAGLALLAI